MTSATIKGQIALLIASKDNLDMPQTTNKQAPTGGVISAIFKERTITIPN